MKIALTHIRHAQVGGTERFLNQLSKSLAEQGHDVTIICRTHQQASHPDIRFVQLRPWAIGRGQRLWRFARDVERHLLSHSYDLVFGLGRTWSQDVVRVGGGLYRQQIYLGLGRQRYWPKDLVAQTLERRTFTPGNYRMVIANSRMTQLALQAEYDIPDTKIVTIHNAVDIERFTPSLRDTQGVQLRQQCGFSADERVFLFLGSGYRRKGLDRLLTAFVDVVARCPSARLLVVGADSRQAGYESLAQSLGLHNRVVFLGQRRDPEVCFNAADCYVMPSRFDAFGFTALEALACGLPVVITGTTGAAEVMIPAVGEVISASETDLPAQLAEAMLRQGVGARDPLCRQRCTELASHYATPPVMARNIAVLERVAREKGGYTGLTAGKAQTESGTALTDQEA